ncbi:UNVERIFIED_CONTAM: hypothetical protein FKN15_049121 [Acipenser sinensis]
MGGKRRMRRQQPLQQQQQQQVCRTCLLGEEWCFNCGEPWHISPGTFPIWQEEGTQTEVRRRQRGKVEQGEEEWCTNCMQYGHEEHHCLEVFQDTDLERESVRPQPKREETERPQPKREESVRPQPKREEAERPQPKREETERPHPKREESVRPQPKREETERPHPKREESVRPQPKREEPVRPQPKRGEAERPQPKREEPGHQRKACPRREARAETGQEQGNAGGEEVGAVGGEREEESAPASQPQPEPVRTKEEATQSWRETGADPPTPRPRTKRVSQSLSVMGSEQNTATTENGEEPFREVVKNKRFKQKAAELPDGRAQRVQSSESVLTGRLQAPARESVPHNAGEENTVEGGPGAVQDSPLAESQLPETVVAGEREEAAETGAKDLEGAAEELTLGGEQEDSADEMGGDLSDSSLISDIPDSQPASKKKLYTLEQVNNFMKETKGKRGVEIEHFFPDLRLFLHSAHVITRKATIEEFDQPKRERSE